MSVLILNLPPGSYLNPFSLLTYRDPKHTAVVPDSALALMTAGVAYAEGRGIPLGYTERVLSRRYLSLFRLPPPEVI